MRPVRIADAVAPDSPDRALAEMLPWGVLVVDADRLLWANSQARALFGGDLSALLAQPLTGLFQPANAVALLRHAAPSDEYSLYLRRADDSLLPLCVSSRAWLHEGRDARLLLIRESGDSAALHTQLTRQRDELQALTQRMVTQQEDERAWLVRTLHDDLGQAVAAIKLCALAMTQETRTQRLDTIGEITAIADQAVATLRDLSLTLRPPSLDTLGLASALRWHIEQVFTGEWLIVELALSALPVRPLPAVELACFRIAQEALNNVLRHADARHVRIELQADDTRVVVCIHDDGRGFLPAHGHGVGLITMRERAQQLGGRLDIESRPEHGTRLTAQIPMRKP